MRPTNLVNTISQIPMKGISPNFGHICILVHSCADYILRLKAEGQCHCSAGNDPKTRVNRIFS